MNDNFDLKVDSLGQLITVPKDVSGSYLDVDSKGYLSTILCGVTDREVVQSIQVDTEGRVVTTSSGQVKCLYCKQYRQQHTNCPGCGAPVD